MTCWRRLRDWNEAGVWQRLHEVLLAELNVASRLDWSRCVVDSSRVRALRPSYLLDRAERAIRRVGSPRGVECGFKTVARDGLGHLAARHPATTRPLIGMCE